MDKGNVIGSPHINGLIQSTFCLKKRNVISITFFNERFFEDKNPINKTKKTEDIKKVPKYINEGACSIYDSIVNCAITTLNTAEKSFQWQK